MLQKNFTKILPKCSHYEDFRQNHVQILQEFCDNTTIFRIVDLKKFCQNLHRILPQFLQKPTIIESSAEFYQNFSRILRECLIQFCENSAMVFLDFQEKSVKRFPKFHRNQGKLKIQQCYQMSPFCQNYVRILPQFSRISNSTRILLNFSKNRQQLHKNSSRVHPKCVQKILR